MLTKPTTHYEALEISPDASPHEVREAYLRLKNAYNKDSVALYTLVSPDEREDILARVESAYQILSDPERRKSYDRCHEQIDGGNGGGATNDDWLKSGASSPASGGGGSIVSIDRVPPMENSEEADNLLIPPMTDGRGAPASGNPVNVSGSFGLSDTLGRAEPVPSSAPTQNRSYVADRLPPTEALDRPPVDSETSAQIESETEWRGETIRKVREARMVSIEELSGATKISKTYLTAVETDDYAKLPAAVFTRGFLIQICRLLKLPQEKVVGPYMDRFNKARASN